jgi:DtxR family transcriptional regulator, Mn-dependent transcriptional regulator
MSGLWWVLIVCLVLLVAWPSHGVMARARRRAAGRSNELDENALKHLLQEAQAGRAGSYASLKGTLRLRDRGLLRVLERLRASGLTASEGGRYTLTARGEQRARHLVRAHRLLERYLADEVRLPLTAVHRVAERLEHRLSEADADRLSASMGHPERDPHGDPIPSAGEGSNDLGEPIAHWRVGEEGRIVHLEDEPAATFSALVHLGLQPGQAFRVLENASDALGLLVEDREVRLPLEHAGNVFVAPLESWAVSGPDLVRLSNHPVDQDAEIVSLSPTCQGLTRRRLLDLGFTPGTRVRPVLQTFAGDPRAYRVRGTTIALRRDQASVVIVRPVAATAPQTSGLRHQA